MISASTGARDGVTSSRIIGWAVPIVIYETVWWSTRLRYAGLSEEVCTALQEDSPLPVPIQRLVGTGRVAGMVQLHQALPLVERQHALIEELRARAPRYVPGTVLAIRTGTTVRTVERSGWLVTSTPCRCGMAAAARRTSPTECRSRDHQLRYLTCVLGRNWLSGGTLGRMTWQQVSRGGSCSCSTGRAARRRLGL